MFAQKFAAGFRKVRRSKTHRIDVVADQVRKMLQETDQKLILMVRG